MNEVLQAGLTAMGPVLHMVTLDEMPGGTAGESAALVPGPECPVDGGGDAAGLAPHIQRHAGAVFRKTHDARVAGEAPGALAGKLRAVFQLRAAGGVGVGKHLRVHVDNDVMPLAGGA